MSQQKRESDRTDANAVPEIPEDGAAPWRPAPPASPGALWSFSLPSGATTNIEAAVWGADLQAEEPQHRFTVTVTRRCLDGQGQWQPQERPSWALMDIPILLFVLDKAYNFGITYPKKVDALPSEE